MADNEGCFVGQYRRDAFPRIIIIVKTFNRKQRQFMCGQITNKTLLAGKYAYYLFNFYFTRGLNLTKFYYIILLLRNTSIYHGLQDKCVVSTCVEFNLYCIMLKHFHASLTVICIIVC